VEDPAGVAGAASVAQPAYTQQGFVQPGARPMVQLTAGGDTADNNWALAAGVLGTVSAALVLGAGLGAEFADETGASIGIGSAGAVVLGVMGPVVVAGSGSARDTPGVDGVPGFGVAGAF
jgi:hypothetical protein